MSLIIRLSVAIISLGALIKTVLETARRREGFPLLVMLTGWTGSLRDHAQNAVVGFLAGLGAVLLPIIVGSATGWVQLSRLVDPVSFRWSVLAFSSVLIKGVYVFVEELIFRGALISQFKKVSTWLPLW